MGTPGVFPKGEGLLPIEKFSTLFSGAALLIKAICRQLVPPFIPWRLMQTADDILSAFYPLRPNVNHPYLKVPA